MCVSENVSRREGERASESECEREWEGERERERVRVAILAQVFPPLSWGRRSLEPQPGGCFGCPAEGEIQIPGGGLSPPSATFVSQKRLRGGAKTASCCPASTALGGVERAIRPLLPD